jgi:protein-disulfide isomerase
MEKNRQDLGAWVDARMRSLDGEGDWRPDAARAWAVLRRRDRTERVRRAGWVGAIAAVMSACLVLLALGGPRACANPIECANEEQAPPSQQLLTNFRESGPPNAKVTVEIYSDYQCPSCAHAFTAGSIPPFVKEYVKTGKVRLIHRDYPLPQHQYARLAARYVNAAGKLGFYDAAVDHIFRMQTIWDKDGSVDAQMAKLLPPAALARVRQMVQTDKSLDAMVEADLALAVKDKINQTPSMVVVAKGKRQLIVPIPNYPLLKSYIDDLLK